MKNKPNLQIRNYTHNNYKTKSHAEKGLSKACPLGLADWPVCRSWAVGRPMKSRRFDSFHNTQSDLKKRSIFCTTALRVIFYSPFMITTRVTDIFSSISMEPGLDYL